MGRRVDAARQTAGHDEAARDQVSGELAGEISPEGARTARSDHRDLGMREQGGRSAAVQHHRGIFDLAQTRRVAGVGPAQEVVIGRVQPALPARLRRGTAEDLDGGGVEAGRAQLPAAESTERRRVSDTIDELEQGPGAGEGGPAQGEPGRVTSILGHVLGP